MSETVAVIINPVSGGVGAERARQRAEFAAARAAAHGVEARVFVTERPGHARELARAAAAWGATTVAAWGGDGTVNEVASALTSGPAALAIIPGGSGNGLARDLGIPLSAAAALDVAFEGPTRRIDAGEFDGRPFFNVAGLGLDARVAHLFAARGGRRGLSGYLLSASGAFFSYVPPEYSVTFDGDESPVRAAIVALANSRQYGNGAIIAPEAALDDGRLDLVVVPDRPRWRLLMQVPRLFTGRIGEIAGVTIRQGIDLSVSADGPIEYHVDGEPYTGGRCVRASVCASVLAVRVPRRA